MAKTDLSSFDNSWYHPGAGVLKRGLWYITSVVFFQSNSLLPYGTKSWLLRRYGATIGEGVVIKPQVKIKYPWKLNVGDYAWIGEQVWIDNLDEVHIGSNACISQGAMILSGNHNYKKSSFDLIVAPITIEQGAWIGAQSVVTQGVNVGEEAVLTVGSVASSNLDARGIYRGNPALKEKERVVEA